MRVLSCRSIAPPCRVDILASELFGHAEGAFTGARRGGARGRFEQGQWAAFCSSTRSATCRRTCSPTLLRVLEEGMVWRLGEAVPRKISVRIIAATNRPLAKDVAAGRFRADPLSSASNVAGLTLTPLRERTSDIPLLADHLLRDIADMAPPPQIAPDVMDIFMHYRWPGNVRELRNCLGAHGPAGDRRCARHRAPPGDDAGTKSWHPNSPAASTMRRRREADGPCRNPPRGRQHQPGRPISGDRSHDALSPHPSPLNTTQRGGRSHITRHLRRRCDLGSHIAIAGYYLRLLRDACRRGLPFHAPRGVVRGACEGHRRRHRPAAGRSPANRAGRACSTCRRGSARRSSGLNIAADLARRHGAVQQGADGLRQAFERIGVEFRRAMHGKRQRSQHALLGGDDLEHWIAASDARRRPARPRSPTVPPARRAAAPRADRPPRTRLRASGKWR